MRKMKGIKKAEKAYSRHLLPSLCLNQFLFHLYFVLFFRFFLSLICIPMPSFVFVLTFFLFSRAGCKILDLNGKQVGHVTSGGQSPSLKKSISMGYVPRVRGKGQRKKK